MLVVKADVQPKSNIPIGVNPKAFTLGVKAEIEKIYFQSAPSYYKCRTLCMALCIGQKAGKKDTTPNLGSQFATLGGPMFEHLLIS
jgi:hypothetical protein